MVWGSTPIWCVVEAAYVLCDLTRVWVPAQFVYFGGAGAPGWAELPCDPGDVPSAGNELGCAANPVRRHKWERSNGRFVVGIHCASLSEDRLHCGRKGWDPDINAERIGNGGQRKTISRYALKEGLSSLDDVSLSGNS